MDICDALQCNVKDSTKRFYFMENLNPKIFEQTILMWKSTLTRAVFPKSHRMIKCWYYEAGKSVEENENTLKQRLRRETIRNGTIKI